jgi:hypothetical protein
MGGGTMRGFRNWVLAAAIAAGLLVGVAPARAQVNAREPDPAIWLRQVYDFYRRAEKSPALEDQATFRLVVKRASKSLAALFKRNDDCDAEGKGVCALDWDFVIDGQASELSNVKVGAAVFAGDKATVTVRFRNLRVDCLNVYFFVREDGQWKVDDIKTKQGSTPPIRIAKLLRDYNYEQ